MIDYVRIEEPKWRSPHSAQATFWTVRRLNPAIPNVKISSEYQPTSYLFGSGVSSWV